MSHPSFPVQSLRKAGPGRRLELAREWISSLGDPALDPTLLDAVSRDYDMVDLANVMIEQSLGYLPMPLGIAGPLRVNGTDRAVPMACEEPSVIAAATFAGNIVGRHGGFTAIADASVMSADIYVQAPDADGALALVTEIEARQEEIAAILTRPLEGMTRRGGGLRGVETSVLPLDQGAPMVKVSLLIDVLDAMGANILNTCAETLRPFLASLPGATVLLAILSNYSPRRRARATCRIPVASLSRGGFDGPAAARRVVDLWRIAEADPARACTHNKGIMNGITSLVLATGNDTRAVEAAAHAWASRSGRYRSLSTWSLVEVDGVAMLQGDLDLPLALGTVGGALGIHPGARLSLAILGAPDSRDLAMVAASLGLGQNFAALWALATEGIQGGHMRLHARRLAYQAGARASEIETLAERLSQGGVYNIDTARSLRNSDPAPGP